MEELPNQRFGIAQAVCGKQRFRIAFDNFQSGPVRLGQRFQNKNCGADLTLCHQTLSISESDIDVGRIFGVGAFIPRRGVGTRSFRQLRQPQKGGGRFRLVARLRAEFAQPQEISFGGLKGD